MQRQRVGHLELLTQRSGQHLDLGAHAEPVVADTAGVERDPALCVSAVVDPQHERIVRTSGDQVDVTVIVRIDGGERPRAVRNPGKGLLLLHPAPGAGVAQ